MSTQVKPVEQLEFKGVYTAGNPIQRPRNTASLCVNFEVMPGNWLRLRTGRIGRCALTNGSIRQFHPFRRVDDPGSDYQLAQAIFAGAPAWHWFNLQNYTINAGTQVEPIATAYDGSFAATKPAAVCNLDDRPVFYNGLGVRDGSNSRPPLSHHYSGVTRYFGLDAYVPGGVGYGPGCTYALGSGYNRVLIGVTVYVGLYHEPTGHYGNGVFAGQITPQGAGTLHVNQLGNLKYATHNATETGELYYVFYATIDGGAVPYLILNAALDGPYKVAVTASTTNLSIATNTTNGWVLDLTKEMPTENFPPRPMRSLAYVNGRLYGSLLAGGSGTGRDFTYVPRSRELTAVTWSASAADSTDKDFLGDPLQSWPLFNVAYTPSGDQPLLVAPSEDGVRVFVATGTSTFLLEEQADGLHEWITISRVHGIGKPQTFRVTRHGLVWVDQRNQIVRLRPGSVEVEVLSNTYQGLLTGQTITCADYVYDPVNLVDRYQVFCAGNVAAGAASGFSVCHDFILEQPGVAYVFQQQSTAVGGYLAAASCIDAQGRQHHIVADTNIYTHEGQPDNNRIPTQDAVYSGGWLSTLIQAGQYCRNWDDFGDADVRKELPCIDLIGDQATAFADPNGRIQVWWWGDLKGRATFPLDPSAPPIPLGGSQAVPATMPQYDQGAGLEVVRRYKLVGANRFWYRLWFSLLANPIDVYYASPHEEGGLGQNFYGSILRALWHVGVSENRA